MEGVIGGNSNLLTELVFQLGIRTQGLDDPNPEFSWGFELRALMTLTLSSAGDSNSGP